MMGAYVNGGMGPGLSVRVPTRAVFVDTQETVAPEECVNCGGWLHAVTRGGIRTPNGSVCDEDCATSLAEHCSRGTNSQVRQPEEPQQVRYPWDDPHHPLHGEV